MGIFWFKKIKMEKQFVYGIEISNESGCSQELREIKIYESKELRDKVFQNSLDECENWERALNFKKGEDFFSYEHSGDWSTKHEKVNLEIIKES